jgi:hypothetical protein
MLEQSTPAPKRPASSSSKATPQRTAATPDVPITETAEQALQSVGALYNAVDGVLTRQVQQAPYATLGIAAGVGFVLGGGLASPMGQMLLRVSMRAFGPPVFNALLQNALERANITLPNTGSR